MKTKQYLAAVKAKLGITSDYGLQAPLGMGKTGVSHLMNGGTMSPTTAVRVAKILELDPLQVIADAELERGSDQELWKSVARKVAALAGLGLLAVLASHAGFDINGVLSAFALVAYPIRSGREYALCLAELAIKRRADVPLGAAVNATARKTREASRQRLSILVADDDRDTVDTLAALLADEGHTVHTVTNGSLVENAVRVFKPQVCILDIEMPGKNGYALVQDILAGELPPHPLMIAISGVWKTQTDRMLARMVGFDHFFAKPADPAALIEVIEDFSAPPDQAA